MTIDIPYKFEFPSEWNLLRTPVRPIELQVCNFENRFDYKTVWNDAVQVKHDNVFLIGPPLYQALNWFKDNCYFEDQNNRRLQWIHNDYDRMGITVVNTNNWINYIWLVSPHGRYKILVNPISTEFAGKNVLMSISQNNPYTWIRQWIDYHYTVHGIDAVLIYDNGSSMYTVDELYAAIKRDDIIIKVVDYNVPGGPMGSGPWEWNGKKGESLPWDSDFPAYVLFEHAKRKYLHCARTVINSAPDELLVINNKITFQDVAAHVETSQYSSLLYDGPWVEPIDSISHVVAKNIPFDDRKFANYWHTTTNIHAGVGTKWLLCPYRNMNYQWHLHRTDTMIKTNSVTYGHYLAMNNNWYWVRDDFKGQITDLQEIPNLKKSLDFWIANSSMYNSL